MKKVVYFSIRFTRARAYKIRYIVGDSDYQAVTEGESVLWIHLKCTVDTLSHTKSYIFSTKSYYF